MLFVLKRILYALSVLFTLHTSESISPDMCGHMADCSPDWEYTVRTSADMSDSMSGQGSRQVLMIVRTCTNFVRTSADKGQDKSGQVLMIVRTCTDFVRTLLRSGPDICELFRTCPHRHASKCRQLFLRRIVYTQQDGRTRANTFYCQLPAGCTRNS